jgi:predicted esterase
MEMNLTCDFFPLKASSYFGERGMTMAPNFNQVDSKEGINSNIMIFFHGIGDDKDNFIEFGKKLELPQTRIVSVRGTVCLDPIMGMKNSGFSWFLESDWFESQGQEIESQSVKETLQSLEHWIKKDILTLFSPERVFLFGFGQGGTIGLELATRLAPTIRLGGIISISGFLTTTSAALYANFGFSSKNIKHETNVLITTGEDDHTSSIVPTKLSTLDISSSVFKVPGKLNVTMPACKAEMSIIMRFLSKRLYLRNLGLEAMADRVIHLEKI